MPQDKIFSHPKTVRQWDLTGYTSGPITLEASIFNTHTRWDTRAFALFPQFRQAGVRAIIFQGATDPVLHPLLLPYITEAYRAELDISVILDALTLPEPVHDTVARYCSWVCFNLAPDSQSWAAQTGQSRYKFEHVLENILRYTSQKPSRQLVGLNCLVTSTTQPKLHHMINLAETLGVDYVRFLPTAWDLAILDYSSFATRNLRVFPSVPVEPIKKCYVHHFIGIANPDYSMSLCSAHRECWGNLAENSFTPTWLSSQHLQAIRRLDPRQCFTPGCSQLNQPLWEIKHQGKSWSFPNPETQPILHPNFLLEF